jgi:cytidylate kinase
MGTIENGLSQVTELIERQLRFWNRGAKKIEKKHPVITISREYGSFGSKIGEQLAKHLNFSFWDQNIVHIIAENSGLNQTLAKSLDEKTNSMIDDLITGVMLGKEATERGYIEQLLKTIHTINKHKNAIIIGRGSQFILKETSFRIRIIAPQKNKIKNLEKKYSEQQALAEITKVDKERISFHKKHFQKDITAPENYDICLNTEKYSIDEAVEILSNNYKIFLKFKTKNNND